MALDLKKSFTENKGVWIFLGLALVIAILLGVFMSPWASSSPDGLEKVAADKGFLKKAEEEKPVWTHSPMKDYTVSGVKNEKVSTALSGFIGVLITVVVAIAICLVIYLLRSGKRKADTIQEVHSP